MSGTGIEIPESLRPDDGEAAVLSVVAGRQMDEWCVASGSLITVPPSVSTTSWRRWNQIQPRSWPFTYDPGGFDFGPVFEVDPFPGVRITRAIIPSSRWSAVVEALLAGRLTAGFVDYRVDAGGWGAEGLLAQEGSTDAHSVIVGVRRPVRGIATAIEEVEMPPSEGLWSLALPPHLRPGRDLGQIGRHRHMANWPIELVGVNWPGGSELGPPPAFVIGRMVNDAWIAQVVPDYEQNDVIIALGWEAAEIDPLGCSIVFEAARDGVTLLRQGIKISDLPGDHDQTSSGEEARQRAWNERTLDIRLPRGPRRTDWGVSLLASDGRLLDRRPIVPRIERVEISMHIGGSKTPASTSVTGDTKPMPTDVERQRAAAFAVELMSGAQRAAAERRITTVGQLRDYLRWRFSARAGELLLLDPYLLAKPRGASPGEHRARLDAVLRLLEELDRPVRAMTGELSTVARASLQAASSRLEVRCLPGGMAALHDRIWLVGETGLLVGTSVNSLLFPKSPPRAATVTDLPWADSAFWREQFEDWWKKAT